MRADKPPIDVVVSTGRGGYALRPLTDAGRSWLEAHSGADSRQWHVGGLIVRDHPRVQAAILAMHDDGLKVANALPHADHGDRAGVEASRAWEIEVWTRRARPQRLA